MTYLTEHMYSDATKQMPAHAVGNPSLTYACSRVMRIVHCLVSGPVRAAASAGWRTPLQLVQVGAAEGAAAVLELVDHLDHASQQRHLEAVALGVLDDRYEVRVHLGPPLWHCD